MEHPKPTITKVQIEGSDLTPRVLLDPSMGRIELEGVAIPEDTHRFFAPLLDWIEVYSRQPRPKTIASFNIAYCNTSSSMYIAELLRRLRKINQSGFDVSVNWYYEEDDEDMRLLGEDFRRISQIHFSIIPIPPID